MKIGESLGVPVPKVKTFNKVIPIFAADPSLLYGVELEIENVPNYEDFRTAGITDKADGSLRNNGREFVTTVMSLSNLNYCLNAFFTKAKLTKENYSERCSVHVHTNVTDMEWDQLKTLLMIYQVVEPLLFEWIGEERNNNIFCVPLHQTNITYKSITKDSDFTKYKRWEKYTALNLLPMYSLGSVEWRHMAGTCDLTRIITWCQLIGSIFQYAKSHTFEEASKIVLKLNSSSAYDVLLQEVFGRFSNQILEIPNYKPMMEEGVLYVKYSLTDVNNTQKPKDESWFSQFAEREAEAIRQMQDRMRRIPAVPRAHNPLQHDPIPVAEYDPRIQPLQVNLGQWQRLGDPIMMPQAPAEDL